MEKFPYGKKYFSYFFFEKFFFCIPKTILENFHYLKILEPLPKTSSVGTITVSVST